MPSRRNSRRTRHDYVELIIGTDDPVRRRRRQLAAFCDVFCEQGYFVPGETTAILHAGEALGHAAEDPCGGAAPASGGARAAAWRVGAVSADHLEHVTPEGIAALRGGRGGGGGAAGGVVLPEPRYAPARALIDAGVPVAIAIGLQPGSCMSFSMPLMMTIACTHMRMTPEEAI